MERVQMCAVPSTCKTQNRAKSPRGMVAAECEGMGAEANTR
jgi:hypothetical protein